MFFTRKDDLQKIKEAVSAEEPVLNEEYREIGPREEAPAQQYRDSAPLFVKVEKYRDILSSLQELKTFISSVKQLFTILHEVETVRSDTLKIMRASMQRLEKSIIEIDSELLRPKGFEMPDVSSDVEIRHVEASLGDLQRQIAILKRELQEIR